MIDKNLDFILDIKERMSNPKAPIKEELLVLERDIDDCVNRYGAEGILIEQVTLGSWDDLSHGNGRMGYSIRTIDALPYRSSPHNTRSVGTFEVDNFEEIMTFISDVARRACLKVVVRSEYS